MGIGGFDERFDWLDLDHDLSMRLRREGWKARQTSRAVAFHEGGGAPQSTEERVERFYAARWYLLRKHHKVRFPGFTKTLVSLRIRAEIALLWVLSSLGTQPHRARYKKLLDSRRNLLRHWAELPKAI
jgi:GT2 family glycosyltransferase